MKIALYSPYLDTLGGGERYMMTIAEILSVENSIDVLLDKHLANLGGDNLKNNLSKRFNLNLEAVNFINAPMGNQSSAILRAFFLKQYDVLLYLTDGSIFLPTAKKNILHIQSPFPGESKTLWRNIKLKKWDLIIYNSKFTQENSLTNWPIRSEVIYPPVDITDIKPEKKKQYILSVGRFFGFLKDKKQGFLIKAFKQLYLNNQMKGWSLHLAGSAGAGDKGYLEELKELAAKLPVHFYPNLDYDKLVKLYGESSIYWHAAGFGEADPTKMEHFGISTVEAMAGGCVPIVIAKGGQKEIVEEGRSGFLWEDIEGLKQLTLKLIEENKLRQQIAAQAIKRANNFSKEHFKEKIMQIIKT